ncbi:hypothetical protein LJR230_001471 [Trinickia sp. LjRoot230]|uniref:hypothetical protein n=1 Tax=Trinickia sp. LjRoot230 TaxID=3342288 RepID=UPI003ECE01B8
MKFGLRALAVIALAFYIAKLGYSWTWIERLFNSPQGSRVYVVLANLFGVNGPEQGDTLVMCVFLAMSFLLAVIVVWGICRYLSPLMRELFARRRDRRNGT